MFKAKYTSKNRMPTWNIVSAVEADLTGPVKPAMIHTSLATNHHLAIFPGYNIALSTHTPWHKNLPLHWLDRFKLGYSGIMG